MSPLGRRGKPAWGPPLPLGASFVMERRHRSGGVEFAVSALPVCGRCSAPLASSRCAGSVGSDALAYPRRGRAVQLRPRRSNHAFKVRWQGCQRHVARGEAGNPRTLSSPRRTVIRDGTPSPLRRRSTAIALRERSAAPIEFRCPAGRTGRLSSAATLSRRAGRRSSRSAAPAVSIRGAGGTTGASCGAGTATRSGRRRERTRRRAGA